MDCVIVLLIVYGLCDADLVVYSTPLSSMKGVQRAVMTLFHFRFIVHSTLSLTTELNGVANGDTRRIFLCHWKDDDIWLKVMTRVEGRTSTRM